MGDVGGLRGCGGLVSGIEDRVDGQVLDDPLERDVLLDLPLFPVVHAEDRLRGKALEREGRLVDQVEVEEEVLEEALAQVLVHLLVHHVAEDVLDLVVQAVRERLQEPHHRLHHLLLEQTDQGRLLVLRQLVEDLEEVLDVLGVPWVSRGYWPWSAA